jgi:hypothetical protein
MAIDLHAWRAKLGFTQTEAVPAAGYGHWKTQGGRQASRAGGSCVAQMSALGYPGFRLVRASCRRADPAALLLHALLQPDLDARVCEAFLGSRGNTPPKWNGNGWSNKRNYTTFRIALVSSWSWRERGPNRCCRRSLNWRRLACVIGVRCGLTRAVQRRLGTTQPSKCGSTCVGRENQRR